MSSILAGVLKSTVGLLCKKLQDYTARQLKGGEFTDEKCRQIIVRELDDIKTKLDGLSRKDLLASISIFKEGVIRLYSSIDTTGESSTKDASTSRCDSVTTGTKDQHGALKSSSELVRAIQSLKITSQERHKSAKMSFEESRKLATLAFSNEALNTEERLLAGKLRIASRILECLDDREAAVRDCLLYLEELQNLPAIQDAFSLWQNREKGITDQLRATFNKKKRMAAIESIRMINALLVELATNCANITMGIYDWPSIKLASAVYHPIFDDHTVLKDIPGIKNQAPWVWRISKPISSPYCSLTSKGEIISLTETEDGLEVTRTSRRDECDLFYKMPTENDEGKWDMIWALNVDENDNVYVVVNIVSIEPDESNIQYKLLTLDASGNLKADRFLEFINISLGDIRMTVVQDGIVIIYNENSNSVYVCRSTNAEEDQKLDLPIPNPTTAPLSLTVSSKSDILIAIFRNSENEATMYIISLHDGMKRMKREVEIPIMIECGSEIKKVHAVFDHFNETILVFCLSFSYYFNACDDRFKSFRLPQIRPKCTATANGQLYIFSNSGELLHQHEIPLNDRELQSTCLRAHPRGLVALLSACKALLLRRKST